MSKLKLVILIVVLLSAFLISRSIYNSNRDQVISSQKNNLNSLFRIAEWTPERRLFETNDIYEICNTFSQTIGDTIAVAFSIRHGWHVYFIKSEDNGENWEDCIVLGDSLPRKDYTFPELAISDSGLIMGFAIHNEAMRGTNLGYLKSTDMGSTWGAMRTVFSSYDHILSYLSSLAASGTNLYFAYYKNGPDSIYVIRSTDWGNSWNESGVNVATASQRGQRLCLRASDNYLHLVWGDETDLRVKYARSTDYGITWSSPLNITGDPRGSQHPYLAVQDTHVVVCWLGYRNSPSYYVGDYFFRQSFDGGETWNDVVELNNLHQTREGCIALNNDILVAAWQDERMSDTLYDTEVMAQKSADNGQGWQNEERLSTLRSAVSVPSIALNDNSIHITWGEKEPNEQGLYYSSSEFVRNVSEKD